MTKFLSGELDFGMLGKRNINAFKNDRKEKDSNQPDYIITAKVGDKWVRCGAFWLKEKKDEGAEL